MPKRTITRPTGILQNLQIITRPSNLFEETTAGPIWLSIPESANPLVFAKQLKDCILDPDPPFSWIDPDRLVG